MRFCIVCKRPISEERLEGSPKTRLCEHHGREIEQFGGEFKLFASQERTSKAGSLKLNYGGMSTELKPNEEALGQLLDLYERQQHGE